ncbi:translation initiation factor IF-2-like [Vulpes lagopus]|uniref:translation initiation factor IF-2-like n=1 Tax=Vulpes lagopus TaxID=494514 RepID=UPI001BC9B28B|nr:translation initiation factor IF-2-like [Vulpes lagopus]
MTLGKPYNLFSFIVLIIGESNAPELSPLRAQGAPCRGAAITQQPTCPLPSLSPRPRPLSGHGGPYRRHFSTRWGRRATVKVLQGRRPNGPRPQTQANYRTDSPKSQSRLQSSVTPARGGEGPRGGRGNQRGGGRRRPGSCVRKEGGHRPPLPVPAPTSRGLGVGHLWADPWAPDVPPWEGRRGAGRGARGAGRGAGGRAEAQPARPPPPPLPAPRVPGGSAAAEREVEPGPRRPRRRESSAAAGAAGAAGGPGRLGT